ncbi:transcription repressor NadR [Bacillus sp. FSL W7-1360]
MENKKLHGENRRTALIEWLKEATKPLPGQLLAKRARVSRQVIVQDMSILKAKEAPILATPQGYIYLKDRKTEQRTRVIALKHPPDKMTDELYIFVDHGITVLDVTVEHPVYGEMTGTLHLSSRQDVDRFCQKMSATNAPLLSTLTDGVHLHRVAFEREEQLEAALAILDQEGFLL